jgi:hypothetical protein
MRTLTTLSLAMALTQASAFAAPQSAQAEPSMAEIQVTSVMPTYRMQAAQVDEIKGVYKLDNGKTFRVSNVHRRLFAQLGDRKRIEMVPLAENLFVAADQRMTMELRPAAFGDEIVLTYPATLNLADSTMVTVRLAAN